MRAPEHPITPEEVMAWRDDELSSDRAAIVAAHVSRCATCRQVGDHLDEVSRGLSRWGVEEPPATLRAPLATNPVPVVQPSRWLAWYRPTHVWQVAGVVAVPVIVVASVISFSRAPNRAPNALAAREPSIPKASVFQEPSARPRSEREGGEGVAGARAQAPAEPETPRRSMIARTAMLRIIAADFDRVRPAVDRILAEVHGFAGRVDVSGERGTARSLHATLRVPGDRLEAALAALRKLGQVIAESQGGDEVMEQVMDLEARLSNARNAENRLTEVLRNRTGDVADVLAVEREIARVRGEIERFDAERKNVEGRVRYATVTVEIAEERKAALDLGPAPVSSRLRNAFVDGCRGAAESALDAALLVMRAGPVLILWGAVLWWPAVMIIRRRRTARAGK
jgi:hypothetical protein